MFLRSTISTSLNANSGDASRVAESTIASPPAARAVGRAARLVTPRPYNPPRLLSPHEREPPNRGTAAAGTFVVACFAAPLPFAVPSVKTTLTTTMVFTSQTPHSDGLPG